MTVSIHDLRFIGFPITRDVLRDEFRQRRSTVRVCSCKRQLNHIETAWVACRTPQGKHLSDHMLCVDCLDNLGEAKRIKEFYESGLTDVEYDTILVLLIRGSELFI
jgi:hypothetical protein